MGSEHLSSTISVALCTRNGAAYIEEQLKSILRQTWPPDEIVVSDDASTDATLAIVRRVVSSAEGKTPDVRIIENSKPLGVVRNFQQAVSECAGHLIALCDQDDVWHDDKLARMAEVFDSRPELLFLHSDARLVDENGSPLNATLFDALEISGIDRAAIHSGKAFSVYLRRNLATGATSVMRRELVDRAIPFPDNWVHDEWLAIMAASFDGLDFLPDCLVDYRQHAANQIGVRGPSLRNKVRRVLERRGQRNAGLAERSRTLVRRLSDFGGDIERDKLERAIAKARFENVRAALPSARTLRLKPVIVEWRSGHYRAYASQGRMDVIRDLIQPHSRDRGHG